MKQYNIIHESWIPVVTMDGAMQVISMREALINARDYQRISASLPHTTAAVQRLLLAVLHRNFGPADAEKWEVLWQRGAFDAGTLDDYFERWGSRFDLFSREYPFFQNRHPLVAEKPAQELLQIIGGGDTFTLFDHTMDKDTHSFTPAEATLLLITAQSFSLAGLCHPQHKLVYTDATCSRAIVFFLEGKNLFETLMFNLVRYNSKEPIPWQRNAEDRPAWEADDAYQPERNAPLGYLDHLTWPNRRIMLLPEERGGHTVVTRITTAPGLVQNAEARNPMYHYMSVPGKKTGEQDIKMMRFFESRTLWRDSHALLDLKNNAIDPPRALSWISELVSDGILPRRRVQVAAYGMCTEPGKQKVHFYRGEGFEIDDQLLRDDDPTLVSKLGTALDRAENLRYELWKIMARLAERMIAFESDQENGRKPDQKDVHNLVNHWNAERLYWSQLEVPFYQFLDLLPQDPERALQIWNDELRYSVNSAYNQIVNGLGDSHKAYKAAASTRGWLSFGIKKVLGGPPKEG